MFCYLQLFIVNDVNNLHLQKKEDPVLNVFSVLHTIAADQSHVTSLSVDRHREYFQFFQPPSECYNMKNVKFSETGSVCNVIQRVKPSPIALLTKDLLLSAVFQVSHKYRDKYIFVQIVTFVSLRLTIQTDLSKLLTFYLDF